MRKVNTLERGVNQSDKRRSMRVVIEIPVSVFGQNLDGKIFEEKTRTVTVNAHGALVFLEAVIDPQKSVLLTNTKTRMEVRCRIAYRKEIKTGRFEIGLEFTDSLPRFWGINFPPENWDPTERKKPTSPQRPISPLKKGSSR
jgi:hypothetical protein